MRRGGRIGGFTLIELMFAVALLAIIVLKLTIVVKEAQEIHGRETTQMALEDKAYQVLDRIVYAIIGADAETLDPTAIFPFFAAGLEYKISMGVEDGETIWGPVEYIGVEEGSSELRWGQNLGESDERFVVWCSNVSDLLDEELENGTDDNGNTLVDETGLTLTVREDSVTIILTLEGVGKGGEVNRQTVETLVTCRN